MGQDTSHSREEVTQPPPVISDEEKIICLSPECGGEPKVRGLCAKCYTMARYLVSSGKVTWEFLEKQGKIFPKGRGCETRKWFLEGASHQEHFVNGFVRGSSIDRYAHIDFENLDWTKSNSKLAVETGVSIRNVGMVRRRLGKPAHKFKMKVLTQEMIDSADWVNTTDMMLSKQWGVSRERVRQVRIEYHKPACAIHGQHTKTLSTHQQLTAWVQEHLAELHGLTSVEARKRIPIQSCYGLKNRVLVECGANICHQRRGPFPWNRVNWKLPQVILNLIWKRANMSQTRQHAQVGPPKWWISQRHPHIIENLLQDEEFSTAVQKEIETAGKFWNKPDLKKLWDYLGRQI